MRTERAIGKKIEILLVEDNPAPTPLLILARSGEMDPLKRFGARLLSIYKLLIRKFTERKAIYF